MNEQRCDIECTNCGMSLGSVMFRDYENGTEWSNLPCCEETE